MAIIIKSHHDLSSIDSIIGTNNNTGKPLQGEKDMFERIVKDCEASSLTWYMWYDQSFNISSGGQNEIQIDFLLICCEGAVVVEVKGGPIDVCDGHYYYMHNTTLIPMKLSPFDQANKYKWALINNKILDKKKIFVDFVCAFPHCSLSRTSNNPATDLSYKLWNQQKHNSNASFADFCLDVIKRKKAAGFITSEDDLNEIVESLMPTIEDRSKYTLTSLNEVLEWLHLDNLNILEGLRKNFRIVIEGGPGTGKTTMAKAYIKRHSGMKGLYLCWTGLLASKVNSDLYKEGLSNCEVVTYNSFVNRIFKYNIQKHYKDLNFKESLSNALCKKLDSNYDFIIVDEAQDVADKGVDIFLNSLLSKTSKGLQEGRYLVFYDLEQGYNRISRNLDDFISSVSDHAACFVLDENKRVPTNKKIVDYANKIFSLEYTIEDYHDYLTKLESNIPGLTISSYDDVSGLKRAIINQSKSWSDYSNGLETTTLLIHSDLSDINSYSVFDSISEMESYLSPLNEKTINNPPKKLLKYTTVLKFKGLEDQNIILVIPKNKIKSTWDNFLFEIYVGMTRAIMNLDVLILNNE